MQLYELAGADPACRFSPYCWRIRLALAHKGLEAETLPWRFTDKVVLPDGTSIERVPVLVDNGQVVIDSFEIACHLEKTHPTSPSLFGGPVGEAHARFIVAWADCIMLPAIFPIIAWDIFAKLDDLDKAYFRQSREKRLGHTLEQAQAASQSHLPVLRAKLAPVRLALKDQEFLGGIEPSFADYAVFSGLKWASCVSDVELLTQDDPVLTWRRRVEALLF